MSLPWERDTRVVIYETHLERAIESVINGQNIFDDSMRWLNEVVSNESASYLLMVTPEEFERYMQDAYLGDINFGLAQLGMGLHALQDIHAHGNLGNYVVGHHAATYLPFLDRFDVIISSLGLTQTSPLNPQGMLPLPIFTFGLVPWNRGEADNTDFDWFCESRRNRLVLSRYAHDPNVPGRRVQGTLAHTKDLLESFIVQSGLYACTRLREDQRIWNEPDTAQIIGMPVGAAVGAFVAGSATAGATTAATAAIGATSIAGSTTTGAPAMAAAGTGAVSSASNTNSKVSPSNTSSSFHPDNMAQSQASAESIEQKKTPSPSSDISKDSKEPPPVTPPPSTPPPRFQQDNRRPPNNSKGTDKESDTTPQNSGSTDTGNFSPTHS